MQETRNNTHIVRCGVLDSPCRKRRRLFFAEQNAERGTVQRAAFLILSRCLELIIQIERGRFSAQANNSSCSLCLLSVAELLAAGISGLF